MTNIIKPAILEDKYIDVIKYLDIYSKISKEVQIDICDGVYVRHKSWLPNMYEDIKGFNLDLEFDMMVDDVRNYLTILYYYDVKRIIIHINNHSDPDYIDIYKSIKKKNKLISVGVAISGKDELSRVTDNLDCIDYVQIMTIESIGMQGSEISERQINKIKILHNFFAANDIKKIIQVDGGMTGEGIRRAREAGATSFAVGSYFKNSVKSNNLKEQYNKLKNI